MFSFNKYIFYLLLCCSKFVYVFANESVSANVSTQDIYYRYSPLKLSLFSPVLDLSLSFGKQEYQSSIENFTLGIIYNESDYIYGIALSTLILKANNDIIGLSIAPLNFVNLDVIGLQIGLFAQTKKLYGLQLGALSEAKSINGVQISLVNKTDIIYGLQLALGSNFASKTNGMQIGLYNEADEVYGVQIGIVNYARKVYGSQIGLINIAGESRGLSLGTFFTLDKSNGFIKTYITFEDQFPLNFGLKIGNKYLYSILEATSKKSTFYKEKLYLMALNNELITNPFEAFYSLGVGSQYYIQSFFIGAEIKWFDIIDENEQESIGKRFSLHYSLLTGVKLNDELESFLIFSVYDMSLNGKFNLINTINYLPDENYLFTFGFGIQAFIFNSAK